MSAANLAPTYEPCVLGKDAVCWRGRQSISPDVEKGLGFGAIVLRPNKDLQFQ